MQYNTTGSYTLLAGVVVLLLSKFGVTVDNGTVETVIGFALTVYGGIKQYIDHKKLAVAASQVGAVKGL